MSEDKNNQILTHQINRSDQSDVLNGQNNMKHFKVEQLTKAKRQVLMADSYAKTLIDEHWQFCQLDTFSMATINFGNGINFLLSCLQFEHFIDNTNNKALKKLFFSAFEAKPLAKADIKILLEEYIIFNENPKLHTFLTTLLDQYPLLITGCHRLHFENITLDLYFGDVNETLNNIYTYQDGLFDCWLVNQNLSTRAFIASMPLSTKNNALLISDDSNENIKQAFVKIGFSFVDQNKKNKTIEVAKFQRAESPLLAKTYGQHFRSSKTTKNKDIAIIGGGISSACLSLALIKRGYNVTLYCKDNKLGSGASGNLQGALYPLLNKQHDALSELFANSFLYARHYVNLINQDFPFDFDFSGLLQLYYDESASKKLDKILQANLPKDLVEKITASQTDKIANLEIGQCSLYYSLGGWLSPAQMVDAIFKKAQQSGQLTIKLNHHLTRFEETDSGWCCHFQHSSMTHSLLALTTAMKTLDFEQSKALPLSAARGQVTHVETTPELQNLKMTLCHEGYLTPLNKGFHCMGATFVRHSQDEVFSSQEQTENKNKLSKCISNKQWVEDIDELHHQANIGIRCTTRDHFPYMGALPDYQKTKCFYKNSEKKMPIDNAPFYNNLFILTGLGSRGLNTAPLLAETLASQINHEPLPLNNAILNALQCNRQWINYLKKGKNLKI